MTVSATISLLRLGAETLLLIKSFRNILVDLSRNLDTFLRRDGLAHLLGYLLLDVDGVLGADCFRKLPALLPRNIDRNICALLLRNIFTLGPGHLLLNLLRNLLAFLLGNLSQCCLDLIF